MRYGLIGFLLVFGVRMTLAGAAPVTPDFSHYPQTGAFKAFVDGQMNAAWHAQRSDFLAISAFYEGERVALQYWITENDEFDVRTVYDHAHQSERHKQLVPSAVKGLHSAIAELPSESVTPPIDHLVIVSFQDGTNWVTRTYDSENLPNAMTKIYEIIGERSETKSRNK
jgi:hypothetical protein